MNEILDKDYLKDLSKIKETIRDNQNKAIVIVNSAMIMAYYEIGTIKNKRKTWGSKYIQKLSEDLKEYGKGYSSDQLRRMARFAKEFTVEEIRAQAAPQIPWFTIVVIMQKSKSHEEMLWYINQTHKNGWSRNMVLNQFELKAYERSLIEPNTSTPIKSDYSIKELFKDSYVFDFLNKDNTKTEKDTKDALIDNVISFIHELGNGFTVVDKEFKITTPDNKNYFIDLLLYHIKIHCYVVIEIKNRKFKPQDLGQLLFYTGAIDASEKTEKDDETIGLLLCKDVDNFTVKTTINKINAKLGISKYKIFEELPIYLEKRLKAKDY